MRMGGGFVRKKLELKNVAKSGKSQNDKMSVYKGFGQRLRQCG